MNQPESSYEVQTESGGRWTIDSFHIAQTVGMSRAQALLSGGPHDVVRVTRETGNRKEEVIFQQ